MQKSILLDATHFEWGAPTGVERYVDALLPPLSAQLVAAGCEVFWVGHNSQRTDKIPRDVQWVHSLYVRGWSQIGISRLMSTGRYGAYFTPSGNVPLGRSFKRAMTVHDLAFMRQPAAYSRSQLLRLRWWGPRAARASARLVVPSAFVAADLERYWHIPMERVAVVPHGPLAQPSSEPYTAIPQDLPLILYVGRIERKKNLTTLVQAFDQLATPARLLVVGGDGFGAGEVRHLIATLSPEKKARVHVPGFLSDSQLRWLFEQAAAVAVPCPEEGFGFPVLDGFAAKAPVVVAAAGGAAEVAGSGGYPVDPFAPAAWAEAFEQVLKGKGVAERLITAGSKRLRDFSWKKSGEGTATTLLTLLDQ
jgi:glycosyltransferase involved in cell wall biosynthesis